MLELRRGEAKVGMTATAAIRAEARAARRGNAKAATGRRGKKERAGACMAGRLGLREIPGGSGLRCLGPLRGGTFCRSA